MIVCPDCESEIYGSKCACGYVVPSMARAPYVPPPDIPLTPEGRAKAERVIRRVRAVMSARKAPSRDWAEKVVRDFEDGKNGSEYAYRSAKSVLAGEIQPVPEGDMP